MKFLAFSVIWVVLLVNLVEGRSIDNPQQTKFPSVVGIWTKDGENESGKAITSLKCGGVLIKPNAVLTSSRCVTISDGRKMGPRIIYVHGGIQEIGGDGKQIVRAIEIILPPEWKDDPTANDIALIILESNFIETATIQVAELPDVRDSSSFDKGILVGWPKTGANQDNSKLLQTTHLSIFSDSHCDLKYEDYQPGFQFCAEIQNSKANCAGLNGNPFFVNTEQNEEEGEQLIWGIASNIDDCSAPLFTTVREYVEWILDNVEDNVSVEEDEELYSTDETTLTTPTESTETTPTEPTKTTPTEPTEPPNPPTPTTTPKDDGDSATLPKFNFRLFLLAFPLLFLL